ncbi:unnamed protein product [Rotaria sp. Silwood2]|nr:unnamed protein product [Rotaria sp. Silwood2]CAF2985000.1 unnamed protein product [Rotaria sp. Silwood2]CAF3158274.1 unnamed protein product [Rotaria sp. Silwood2]CAF3274438.1 unnamed protein product [Rotaria sp. Silwood2]CAF4055833.1 unnamed protein product [Rotaria sp. Silwood2]
MIMDGKLTTISTSPDSILSGFSSSDSIATSSTVPSASTMSVFPPLRSSFTMANINKITNFNEDQSFFLDGFNSERFSTVSRWQSDAENLNLESDCSTQQSSSKSTYLINDFLTNKNIASSSITDALISPMSRLSTSSSSIMSFNSIGNHKTTGQRSSRSDFKNSTEQLTMSNGNIFPSTSSFLPLRTPSSNRQTFSSIENIPSTIADNDLQRVPHSWMLMSSTPPSYETGPIVQQQPPIPQLVHSANRSNSMPSWRGYLPMKFEPMLMDQYQITSNFSQKVFLGGIPAELTEVFRESRSVCELLKHCTRQQRSTIDYFLHIHMTSSSSSSIDLSMRTNRLKPIQIVPWNVRDNVYVMQQVVTSNGNIAFKDWSRTIFVSPLHGKMTAFSLATIMSNVFGPVSMAQINTDKYGYPTGTGTILFSDSHSYMRAVAAGAIDIKCDCFHKLLDIDPFLRENEPCTFCPAVADLFCRNFHCLRSYCKHCWVNKHGPKPLADHQPATRRQQPLPHT